EESVPIGHVTNGVHAGTWVAHPVIELLSRQLGSGWDAPSQDPARFQGILELDERELWEVHQRLKNILLTRLREDARRRWTTQWKEAAHVVGAGTLLDPDALTIGFARRFATYKRADLMFRDHERLRRLLVNERRPVQVVFAGKAHPADQPGKEVLQTVYGYTRDPDFQGRVAFLEDYDMHVAHLLVQGVDMWLNLPRVPMEACGTSGIKAAMNGVPQTGTLDGWWHEGYEGSNGWAIPFADQDEQTDEADAAHLYELLEQEIIPTYYERDARGIPMGWVNHMRQAMRVAFQRFTARRMVQDYVRDYYIPAIRGHQGADDPPVAPVTAIPQKPPQD
ncbi:MAG: alpha-glucan family phosphorylase, partial [Gemmatimonadales bacterium]